MGVFTIRRLLSMAATPPHTSLPDTSVAALTSWAATKQTTGSTYQLLDHLPLAEQAHWPARCAHHLVMTVDAQTVEYRRGHVVRRARLLARSHAVYIG